MKRFLAYCLLAVTLFIGVASTAMFGSESSRSEIKLAANHKVFPDQHQGSFSAINLFLSTGIGNQQTELLHSFQNTSFRLFNTSSNSFSISHSTRQGSRQFSAGCTCFLLKSAYKQLDGYYLYFLRKLLI